MFYTTITNIGLQKITQAIDDNTKISLTKIVVGDGDITPSVDTTELVHQVAEFNINRVDIDSEHPNRIKVEALLPNNLGELNIKEIGVLDSDGDLFAVGNIPETYIPNIEDAVKEVMFEIYIDVTNVSTIDVSIDDSLVYTTVAYFKSHFTNSNLDGKKFIYKGTSQNYKLTDYDSFSVYSVSATVGTVELNKDILTLTIPNPEEIENSTEINIVKDDVEHKYTIQLLPPAVLAPTITSPANGATGVYETPAIEATAFKTAPANYDTQHSRSYQIATDENFNNIVIENIDDTINKTEWTIPAGNLQEDTTYYVRIRDKGNTLGYSNWSEPISFTTIEKFFTQEAILLHKTDKFVKLNDIKKYNNGYVVVGHTSESEDTYYRGEGANTGIILILDRQFNIVKAKEMTFADNPTGTYIFSAVDIDTNGDIYVGGVAYFDNNSNPNKMLSSIFVFDENLNILKESHWDNTHPSNSSTTTDGFITDIKVTTDRVIFTSAEYGNSSSYGWLTVINKSNHTRIFARFHQYMGHAFCIDDSGNIYSVGQFYSSNHYYDRIIKIEPNGDITAYKTLYNERSWGSSIKYKNGFLWYVTQGRFLTATKINPNDWSVIGKQILYAGDTWFGRRADIDIDTNGNIYVGGGEDGGTLNFIKFDSNFNYKYHKKVKNYDTYYPSVGINRVMTINNKVLFLGGERATDNANHKSKGLIFKVEDDVLQNGTLPNFTDFEIIDFSVSNVDITSISNSGTSGVDSYNRNSIGLPENYILQDFTFDHIYREEF